jgi:hypothetical protein
MSRAPKSLRNVFLGAHSHQIAKGRGRDEDYSSPAAQILSLNGAETTAF